MIAKLMNITRRRLFDGRFMCLVKGGHTPTNIVAGGHHLLPMYNTRMYLAVHPT